MLSFVRIVKNGDEDEKKVRKQKGNESDERSESCEEHDFEINCQPKNNESGSSDEEFEFE